MVLGRIGRSAAAGLFLEDIVGPAHGGHGAGESVGGEGEQNGVADLVGGEPDILCLAHGGVNGTFGLSGGSDADLDEAAGAIVEWTRVVALIAKFLKSFPGVFVFGSEELRIFRQGRFFHGRNALRQHDSAEKLDREFLGVADLCFEDLADEMASLANFGKGEETVDLFALLLGGDNTGGAKSGELNGNIGHGNVELLLKTGNSVGVFGEEIEDAEPGGVGEGLADAHLAFVKSSVAV